ncbi:rCG49747, partial [Rattus norvegicus]
MELFSQISSLFISHRY